LETTLPNVNRFSKFVTAGKRMNFATKMYKNFYYSLNVLLHYLVKYKHSKMTQIVQKLR